MNSCSNAETFPARKDSQRDAVARLVRAAIRGDRDALGELCELVRPDVSAFSRRRLFSFGFESDTEDVVQSVFLDVVRSFPKYDPTVAPFFAWLWGIVRNTLHDYVNSDRVRLKSEYLPDNLGAEGGELCVDPLDLMAHAAWETDYLELPTPVPREKKAPRRVGFGRTAKKALEQRRKERADAEKEARQASGKRQRNRRCLPHQRVTAIRRRREEWAEASP